MNDSSYDVIIVGGGPVGLAQALALTRFTRGMKVALVDRRAFSVPDDQRAYAIAAGVRRVLEALGAWAAMAAEATPINAMKITDSGTDDVSRPLFLNFGGEVAPGEPFAHMVPNRALTAALLEAVTAAGSAISLVAPVEITGFAGDGAAARLTLADGARLVAPLVVAADGAQSALRSMAGITTLGHDYGQAGIVTTISHQLPHQGVAYEHFRPAGPFASLPLGVSRSSLVWTESVDRAAELKKLPPETVAGLIEDVMGHTLGAVVVEDRLQSFPLRLQIARSFIGPRLALIGDAAHVVHPVAGQGLNLGLKDVAALAESVVEAMRLGLDPGGAQTLERYERWRRFDTATMALATDAMNRLFSNDVAPVRALRDFGLGLVDRTPPVKAALIARAAGVERSGPRLLRGLPV